MQSRDQGRFLTDHDLDDSHIPLPSCTRAWPLSVDRLCGAAERVVGQAVPNRHFARESPRRRPERIAQRVFDILALLGMWSRPVLARQYVCGLFRRI